MHFFNMSGMDIYFEFLLGSNWASIEKGICIFDILQTMHKIWSCYKLKFLEAHSNYWLALKIMPLMWYELSIFNQKT